MGELLSKPASEGAEHFENLHAVQGAGHAGAPGFIFI